MFHRFYISFYISFAYLASLTYCLVCVPYFKNH